MSDENNRLDISDEMIAERRQGTGKMPDDMPKWMANTINTIDKSSKFLTTNQFLEAIDGNLKKRLN